jgi:hypothetical protein
MTAAKQTETPAVETNPLDGLAPGRIVHYWPHEHETRNAGPAGAPTPGPWAAIVTLVGHRSWPETQDLENPRGLVNLNVQMPMCPPVGHDPVARFEKVPYSETPTPGCWTWMFQGQGTRYKP